MVKKIVACGLASLLVGGALSLKRSPIELNDVSLGGYSYSDRPNVALVFYDNEGTRFPIINKDKDFDHVNSYDANGPRVQGDYNVRGHKNFWGNYATSIKPAKGLASQ
jgi:hypothetical protein